MNEKQEKKIGTRSRTGPSKIKTRVNDSSPVALTREKKMEEIKKKCNGQSGEDGKLQILP